MRSPPLRVHTSWAPEFLAAIVDSTDDAVVGKTLDGTIISWNRGAERIYGYTPEEVVGRSISILVPPDRPDEIPRILDRLRRGERIDHYQTKRVPKDGRPIDVSVTISPVRNEAGEIIGASAISRDISAQKQAVEEAIRLREDFISIAAHELRSPLATVYARIQLAERRLARAEPELDTVRLDVSQVRLAADRLRILIDRLLDTSRISSGRLALERDKTDVGELVRSITAPLSENSGREIVVRPVDGPAIIANIDSVRVGEVVENLLENAIKYTPAGSPIEVDLRSNGREVSVAVSDHGPGIPPDEVERIFEPFHSANTKLGGVGLGLHVAREIAQLHGGSLEVDGADGGGARFVMTLPKDHQEKPAT
jgi:PAS domain S-box-containing protein